MADAKTDLSRAGTMQLTAKEGISYLKDSKKDTLLEMQGLAQRDQEKQAVPPAKDGEQLPAGANSDADAVEEPVSPAKKSRMAKGVTMIATAKEANQLMGENKPDADAQTRGQQKKLVEIQAEKPSASKKSPAKLSKNTTMIATAKEAKALLDNEKLGDTRAESKKRKAAPKRTSTMQKTMDEAKFVVGGGLDVNEGRRTRSASKPQPPVQLKKAGTMQRTAKEGKEYLKRGRKPKKAVEPVAEEEDGEEESA